MKQQQIIVEVDQDGAVTIEAVGFKGAACEKATAEIEKALGVVASRRKKPEFHQTVTNQQTQKLGS